MKQKFRFAYIKALLRPNSKASIKSFSMFLTTILGFILGLLLGAAILIDSLDGKIDSDMYGCAAYVISIGALVTLSALPKIAIDRKRIEYNDSEVKDEVEE